MVGNQTYPKLSPFIVKRYEPTLSKYFFYNAKRKTFWSCDFSMGEIISCFDGSLNISEILDIISANNSNIDRNEIEKKVLETLEFLLEEGFVYEA